jgi:molecular chaperone DnaK (HSP70)
LDSYVPEASAGGFRYQEARTDLTVFEKVLVFNLGHGSEDGYHLKNLGEI